MSGPRGMNYRVVSAEELARRELQTAQDRLRTRQDAVRVLAQQAGPAATGAGHAPSTKKATDLAGCAALEAEWTAYESRLREAMEHARVARGREALAVALAPIGTLPALDLTVAVPNTPHPVAGRQSALEAEQQRLTQALNVAAGLDDDTLEQCRRLTSVARTALAGGDLSRAGLVVSQLEAVVVSATARRSKQNALNAARSALVAEFADVTSRAPDELTHRLAEATSQADLDVCAADLAAIRAKRDRELDRRYVLDAARATLEDLGYVVTVIDPGDGATHLSAMRQDWPNHGLDVVLPEGRGTVHTVPIALAPTDVRDDLRFEQVSCQDIDTMCRSLRDRGVVTDSFHAQPPGAVPIRRASTTTERRTKARAEKEAHRG